MSLSHSLMDNYLVLSKDSIEVRYIEGDRQFAEETFIALKEALIFLSDYFCLKELFPSIRAILVPDRSEYDRLVVNLLGVNIRTPSDSSRIAQPQKTDIVFLSPSAYKDYSVYKYDPKEYTRVIFHELTHVFEEYLTPDIETTPVWWSEGLAIYLSKQYYEEEIIEPVLKSISEKLIPDIEEIQNNIKLCYIWGWTVVAFIKKTYGKEMILKIVKECSNGNVFGIFTEDAKDFEKKWKEWLLESEKSNIYSLKNCDNLK
ncbi:MAG TPA: hypothetical protein PLU14_00825 [Caldisericia bacterium]|nr:hypothetical protein [Caldisericia bacterium]